MTARDTMIVVLRSVRLTHFEMIRGWAVAGPVPQWNQTNAQLDGCTSAPTAISSKVRPPTKAAPRYLPPSRRLMGIFIFVHRREPFSCRTSSAGERFSPMDESQDAHKPSAWRQVAERGLLWIGGLTLLLMAVGALVHPSSWAFVWFAIAALALLPPTRAIISKWVSLTDLRTTIIVSLAVIIGLSIAGGEDTRKRDAEAIRRGYASYAEYDASQKATAGGFKSIEEYKIAASQGFLRATDWQQHNLGEKFFAVPEPERRLVEIVKKYAREFSSAQNELAAGGILERA